jgi:hypothetical protein
VDVEDVRSLSKLIFPSRRCDCFPEFAQCVEDCGELAFCGVVGADGYRVCGFRDGFERLFEVE